MRKLIEWRGRKAGREGHQPWYDIIQHVLYLHAGDIPIRRHIHLDVVLVHKEEGLRWVHSGLGQHEDRCKRVALSSGPIRTVHWRGEGRQGQGRNS